MVDWQDCLAVGLAVAVATAPGAGMESMGASGSGERAGRSAMLHTGLLIGAAESGRNPSHCGWIKVAAGGQGPNTCKPKNGSMWRNATRVTFQGSKCNEP